MPQEDQGYFTVELDLPEWATIESTREVTDRAMKFLMADPDVEYVLNVTGSSPRVGTNQARSQLTVILKPWGDRDSDGLSEVMQRVRAEMLGVRRELEQAYNEFDNITDPLLMEACIYEINALRAKYNCAVHDLKNLTQ